MNGPWVDNCWNWMMGHECSIMFCYLFFWNFLDFLGSKRLKPSKEKLVRVNLLYLPKARSELEKESLPSGNWGQVGLLALEAVFFSEETEDLGWTQIRIRDWMALEGPNNWDQDKGRSLERSKQKTVLKAGSVRHGKSSPTSSQPPLHQHSQLLHSTVYWVYNWTKSQVYKMKLTLSQSRIGIEG